MFFYVYYRPKGWQTENSKILVIAFWQGEIFYLKISKYLNGNKGGPYSTPVINKLSIRLPVINALLIYW